MAAKAQPEPVVLDLKEAILRAVANSPVLEDYQSRIREARYQVDEIYAQNLPQLEFSATYNRVEPPVAFDSGGRQVVISEADNYNFNLVLNQAILTFGRLHYAALASELSVRSARENYRTQLDNLVQLTAADYTDVLLAAEEVEVARQNLAAREATLENAQLRFDAGQLPRFDVISNQAAASNARSELIVAENRLATAEARLATRLGLPPNQPLELAPLPVAEMPELDLAGARERALEARPELDALRWSVEAAEARVGAAAAEDNPRLDLQNSTVNRNVTGFSPGTQNTTSLVLSIPLFDGGITSARVNQAREAVVQLQAALEDSRRTVLLQVEAAHRELYNAWQLIESAEQTVAEAAEALRIARLRYESDVSTVVEMLEAQAAYSRAQLSLARARAAFLNARWDWWRATAQEYPFSLPIPEGVLNE